MLKMGELVIAGYGENDILICPACKVQHKLLRVPNGETEELEIGCAEFKAVCSSSFKDAELTVKKMYNEGILIKTYQRFNNLV